MALRLQRTPISPLPPARQAFPPPALNGRPRSGRRRRRFWASAVGVAVALIATAEIALALSHPSLSADGSALARVEMPLGGGTIRSVLVTAGPHSASIPVELHGTRIWPQRAIDAGKRVQIEVVVTRPGVISWLTGATERVRLALTAPTTTLRAHYLTLSFGAPLRLRFSQPVTKIDYGQPGAMRRRVLPEPRSLVDLPRSARAGSELVAAAPRGWESGPTTTVSWFPAGTPGASAIATPAPGSRIGPRTPVTLTFSKPVGRTLGGHLPPISPVSAGAWHQRGSHTITFQPTGYGYGLDTQVTVPLPSSVKLITAGHRAPASVARWSVPPGSTVRLQQILAQLGYLPVTWLPRGAEGADTVAGQEAAALNPPRGQFSWLYPHIPGSLAAMWSPGAYGAITKGALMAFENDHNLTSDGIAGPSVWHALIAAAIAGRRSTVGYTYVMVDKATQSLRLWHDGLTLLRAAVNTGIASAPTTSGTFPVYEHIASGTMSGTNPDGSHYHDPNVPWISYFNGGDALHGFYRAQYGYPQSLGCVEMPPNTAEAVWKYTPIGALVHVA